MLCSNDNRVTSNEKHLDAVSFFVCGESGAGKTAAMAELARRLYERAALLPNPRPIVIRFCGTNIESNTGLGLVISICKQIHYLFHGNIEMNISLNYDEAVKYLHQLLVVNPVVLFIDSIDQLSNQNKERTELSFLHNLCPHNGTRIIVSCLPDSGRYSYGCETFMKKKNVSCLKVNLVGNGVQGNIEIGEFLDNILLKKGRKLTVDQRNYALTQIEKEPTALCITLVARIVSNWKSLDKIRSNDDMTLGDSVVDIIKHLFDSMKREYGTNLINAVVAFITLSKNGVSDLEIIDLLSLDSIVMNEVNQYSTSKKLPAHVWYRLRGELHGLIMTTANDCIKWYHRQLWETSESILTEEMKKHYHQILGTYFGNLVEKDVLLSTGIEKQVLVLRERDNVWKITDTSNINVRRCEEASYNLIHGGLYKEAVYELCNLDNICACIKVNEGFNLLKNTIDLLEKFRQENITNEHVDLGHEYTRLLHYYKWLQSDIVQLVQFKDNVWAAITNTCTSSQPLISIARNDVEKKLLHNNVLSVPFSAITKENKNSFMLRCKSLGGYEQFQALQMTLQGHTHTVKSVAFSADGTRIVSGSKFIIISYKQSSISCTYQ